MASADFAAKRIGSTERTSRIEARSDGSNSASRMIHVGGALACAWPTWKARKASSGEA